MALCTIAIILRNASNRGSKCTTIFVLHNSFLALSLFAHHVSVLSVHITRPFKHKHTYMKIFMITNKCTSLLLLSSTRSSIKQIWNVKCYKIKMNQENWYNKLRYINKSSFLAIIFDSRGKQIITVNFVNNQYWFLWSLLGVDIKLEIMS